MFRVDLGKTFNCKLIKVSRPEDLGGGLRTDEVEGCASKLPEEGDSFSMAATPLTTGMDIRAIETNRVRKVTVEGKKYTFETDSGSVYRLIVESTAQ